LQNVYIRSESNLLKPHVHVASIPHGQFHPYHDNCLNMIRDPVDGGCDAGDQLQVPVGKLQQSWRDGGCGLFQDHWDRGSWCTRFNASMQGTFGDANYTFTSIKVFWSEGTTKEQIHTEEPGVELSWRIPVSVPLDEANSDDANADVGYQVVYYSLKGGFTQKTEMFFILVEDVTYTPLAYFLENIGFGHLRPPTREFELLLDSQFSRPAISKNTHQGTFAGQFYFRASQMKRIVTRTPRLRIATLPSNIGGLCSFLTGIGTFLFFLTCRKQEVCLDEKQYKMMNRAKEMSRATDAWFGEADDKVHYELINHAEGGLSKELPHGKFSARD